MSRTTLFVIVEGQTENAFLTQLLGGYCGSLEIDLFCPLIQIGRSRGGVRFLSFDQFCDQILRHLKDRRQPIVSTFFDYYAFPRGIKKGWEFVEEAKEPMRGVDATVQQIENEIRKRVLQEVVAKNMQTPEARFIPYIQLHELEALYFAEPAKMADVFENPALTAIFEQIVLEKGGCEKINDSPETAPSKRIEQCVRKYIKGRTANAHGPRLAERMSLLTIRQACPRFNQWLERIESLAPRQS
jgi:hypothetical protein